MRGFLAWLGDWLHVSGCEDCALGRAALVTYRGRTQHVYREPHVERLSCLISQ